MKSDCIWVCTRKKRKKDIIEAAKKKADACFGHNITKITSIQSQFKLNAFWHSHIWYHYKTSLQNDFDNNPRKDVDIFHAPML